MRRTIHMCVDVFGALRWSDRELAKMFMDANGGKKQGSYVRDWLRLQLTNGIEVLPIGKKCDGWSDKTGCPGHEIPEAEGGTEP